MNGSQKAVLWIGLIIVAANLVMKWKEISGVIFGGASGSGGVSSSDPASGGISTVPGIGAPSSGGVTVPFGGFPITIPVSKTSGTGGGVTTVLVTSYKKLLWQRLKQRLVSSPVQTWL